MARRANVNTKALTLVSIAVEHRAGAYLGIGHSALRELILDGFVPADREFARVNITVRRTRDAEL